MVTRQERDLITASMIFFYDLLWHYCFMWCILKRVFGDHMIGLPPTETQSAYESEPGIELSYSNGTSVRGSSYKYTGAARSSHSLPHTPNEFVIFFVC